MRASFEPYKMGPHWLAIPVEHYDEAVKLLTSGGVFCLEDVKARFPGIYELPKSLSSPSADLLLDPVQHAPDKDSESI